jgi:nitroreductase
MDYDDLLEVFKNRRSIRRFTPDPIPDETVEKIIEAARWAPSGFNTQPWEFVVIKKKALKDQIYQFVNDYRNSHYAEMEKNRETWQKAHFAIRRGGDLDWRTAPVYILILGDTRAKAGLPMTVRYHVHKCQSIFTSSLANAYLYMFLAATTLGLAGQWVSAVQVPLVNSKIRQLLGIPETLEIYDILVVGYAAMKTRPKFLRGREDMVHYDDCGPEDFRTDEEVRDFLRRTRSWSMATINRKADK